VSASAAVLPPKSVSPVKSHHPSSPSEPYTPQRSLALFRKYVDSDDSNVIGPEGYEKLCSDASFPLEGLLPLLLAWQLGSKEMGKITKDEWTLGMGSLKSVTIFSPSCFFANCCCRISSLDTLAMAIRDLEDLLISNKLPPKKSARKDPYDKATFWTYCEDKKVGFQKFYMFCFALAKPE
jgi:DCN1-like protein 4/5